MWVSGGIDAYGGVIGHPCALLGEYIGDQEHTAEEKAITTFRWDVNSQEFMDHMLPPKRHMSEDEYCKVQDWLVNNGYADDESFI